MTVPVTPQELTIVADLLRNTLVESGYLDDWEDIFVEKYGDIGYDEAIKFAQTIDTSIQFINRYASEDVNRYNFRTNFVERANEFNKAYFQEN